MGVFILAKSQTSNNPEQSQPISGVVTDTLNSIKLRLACVTLLRASDSIMVGFTRTEPDGRFTLPEVKPGKYVMLVSFPSFADYVDDILVKGDNPINLGTIAMVSKTHLLSEFVLKQQLGSIKIKGDTTEYLADSFMTRENASVEDLLKKLPGIQINKNGEVTAQGEKVQKILVDGEEFFTDDPAVVTKSLQAKAVDRVQVYDKKSDQAEFTGIDDGTREKTINLKLKDKYKKGYFGKLATGGGSDGYFENQGMINLFQGKRKLSAFAIVANTGKIGLNWQDRDKFGAGNNNSFFNDGAVSISLGDEDDETSWSGTYSGNGLPKVWTGGLHYSNKWLEDKLHNSANYRYSKQTVELLGNTLTQYNLTGARYYSDEHNTTLTMADRHRVDGKLEWKADSATTLTLNANAGYIENSNGNRTTTQSRDSIGNELNRLIKTNNSTATTRSANSNFSYRKKLGKQGRTLSFDFAEGFRANTSTSKFVSSTNVVGKKVDSLDFDQLKNVDSRKMEIKGTANYTEPLSKILFLEFNYAYTLNNSFSKRLTFNKNNTDGQFTSLDTLYSTNYDFDVQTHSGGTAFRIVHKKTTLSLGGSIATTSFNQKDKLRNTTLNRNFNNFFPKVSFTYRPGQQSSLNLEYSGATEQPTIDQIQRIRQNSDPLNQVIGNPNLKQQFNHNFSTFYHSYKVLSGTYIYSGANFTVTDNDISRSETISRSGFRTYQYINVDGNFSGNFWGGIGREFKKPNIEVGVNIGGSISRRNTFVNGVKNLSDNNSFNFGLDFDKDEDKKYELSYNPSISFVRNSASVNQSTTNYITFSQSFDATVQLPHHFEIASDIQWDLRQKVAAFDRNNNVFQWNAHLSKKMGKKEEFEARFAVFDMLNQNIGFSRTGNGNTVTEENYLTIRRYGLLSFIWNFTKSPASYAKDQEKINLK
jgi:hypothetical protein